MKLLKIGISAALLIAFTGVSKANYLDVRIDLSNDHGSASGNWNVIDESKKNSTVTGLVDYIDGTSTDLSITGSNWDGEWHGSWHPENDQDVGWVEYDAGMDHFNVYKDSASIEVVGLSTSKSYQVEIVSAYGVENGATFHLTVDNEYADRSYQGITDPAALESWDAVAASGYNEGDSPDWLIWDDVTSDTGNINLTSSCDSDYANIKAIRISEVPEPATMAMLGLGGLFLRRRKA
ncbi:PEP-CTERM sorting domain-containing protein [Sedimentisphaera salicampi]|uniref:PEP-CTERM protein-sorting domain-containing protein n=1 Tax=Sedimentisphaera salicampi TaxID=1941349 RepID=A0A1W6LKC0_9BACT|nr:PEP-CTERM sorting domain-containing protein [Sedimentisphaera salicampi]ARN56205.1 PEP-CTERM protein-sorting domain-containing protein [Sedimentisphaera salicampi]